MCLSSLLHSLLFCWFGHSRLNLGDNDFLLSFIAFSWLYHFRYFYAVALFFEHAFNFIRLFLSTSPFINLVLLILYCFSLSSMCLLLLCVRACVRVYVSGMFAFVFQRSVTFMGCSVRWIRMWHANSIEQEQKPWYK